MGNEDADKAEGWSIANSSHSGYNSGTGAWTDHSGIKKIRIAGYAKDSVPPLFSTATVDGTELTLTYHKALDPGSTPATGDFTVSVDGSTATVSTVDVDGPTVVLTLAAEVTPRQTVTLSYAKGANPIQNVAGTDAAALTTRSVTVVVPPPAVATGLTATPNDRSVTVGATVAASDVVERASVCYGTSSPLVSGGSCQIQVGVVSLTNQRVTLGSDDRFSITVSRLTNGTPYYFAVRLQNDFGRSAWSDEISATPTASALRALSLTDADDNALALAPAFAPTTAAYTRSVINAVTSVKVTATVNTMGATLAGSLTKADGMAEALTMTSGTAVTLSDLAEGANVLTITVTAGDGTSQAYTLTVTRAAADSTPPALSTATASGTTLTLTYDEPLDETSEPAVNAFEVTVGSGMATNPTAVDVIGDTVVLTLATEVTSGQTVKLNYAVPGMSPIQDPSSNKAIDLVDQTVTVLSADATLGALSLTDASDVALALDQTFAAATATYTKSVTHSITSVKVTATVSESNATLAGSLTKAGGTPETISMTSGTAATLSGLAVGDNVLTITVTAQNGMQQAYTLTVTRLAASSDAALSALALADASDGALALDQTFAADTAAYTKSVDHAVTSVRVTATANHAGATLAGSLTKDGGTAETISMTSGAAATLSSLAVGDNVLTITVTAEDSTEQAYTLTVTRAASSDATLSALALTDASDGALPLDQTFASDTAAYTRSVGNAVTSVQVTATVNESNATLAGSLVKAGGTPEVVTMTSGMAATLSSLAVGDNVLTITVTAEDSTEQAYTLTVTRAAAASSDATLSALALTDASNGALPLDQAFAAATTTYTRSVDNAVSSVKVTATVNESNATLAGSLTKAGGMAETITMTSGMAVTLSSLAVGANVLTITVTAEDSMTQAYTLTVTRAAAAVVADPVLVSNTGQMGSGSASSFGFDRAQGFTTGDHAAGYTLTQVDWRFNPLAGAEPTYTVEIWSESSNRPDTKLATLTNPDTLVVGLNSFTATGGGVDLDAETTYFIVLDVSARARRINVPFISTNNEDAGAASGWSIADGNFTRGFATTAWGNSPEQSEMIIAIRGIAKTVTQTPTVTLALDPATIPEGGTQAQRTTTVTASLNVAVSTATTVTVSVPDSAAYAVSDNKTLTIAADALTSTGVVTITAVDNNVDAADLAVAVSATASGGVTTAPADVELTITDDDTAPTTINLSVNPTSVGEADGATSVTVTAAFPANSAVLTTATDVTVSVAAGTAEAADFTAVSDFTVTIAAGMTSGTGTFTFTPTSDTANEGNETVIVSGSATGITTVNSATLTITDDDATTTMINLTVNPTSVDEAAGDTNVTVTAAFPMGSTALADDTVVTVSVGGGTGDTAGAADFTAVDDFTVTISSGMTSGTGTFTFTPTNDVINEGNETVAVSGAVGGFTVTGTTLTITDDDTAPSAITLSVTPPAVGEAAGGTSVTVTAEFPAGSGTLPAATDVTVSVAAGTAQAADFTAVSDFTVSIPAGMRRGTADFTFTPVDDAMNEGDETVTVSGTATGITITPATLTITDNDVPGVTLSQATVRVEEGSTMTYTVVLDAQPSADVTVTPSSGMPGVATVSGPLTFTMTDWATPKPVTVTGADDDIINSDRMATISHAVMSADTDYASVSVGNVAVTVVNEDAAGVMVNAPAAGLQLDAETPSLTYTIWLTSEPTGTVTVTVASSDTAIATASSPLNFTAASWNMPQNVTVTATSPETAPGRVTLTHTVASSSDANYDRLPLSDVVRVEVGSQAGERIARATKMTQPEFLRMAMNFAVDAITARLAPGGRAESGSALGLVGRLLNTSGLMNTGYLPQTGLPAQTDLPAQPGLPADGSSSAAPAGDLSAVLSAVSGGHAASEGALSRALGESGASIWASGGYRKQNGRDDAHLKWSGDAYHLHVGVDKPFGDDLIGGLSVGYFSGDFDYSDRSDGSSGSGAIDTKISSIQPYLGWRPSERLNLWGMVGYGEGDIEVSDEDMDTQISDADQRMVALGGSYRLRGDPSTLQLDLKAEVTAGRLKIDGNGEGIEASSVSATRWRLAVEGTREVALEDGRRLLPSLALGARVDRGDGVTGTGAELNAGLDYHDAARGLLVQTDVRWLPGYGSAGRVREWAASGAIRLLPQASGRGLSFELSQSWGDVSSGVERLWNDGAGQSWGDAVASGPRLETRLGYGLSGMGGLLTPYFGATHEGEGGSLLLGADWQRGQTSFSLRGERRAGGGQESDYFLRLELKSSW